MPGSLAYALMTDLTRRDATAYLEKQPSWLWESQWWPTSGMLYHFVAWHSVMDQAMVCIAILGLAWLCGYWFVCRKQLRAAHSSELKEALHRQTLVLVLLLFPLLVLLTIALAGPNVSALRMRYCIYVVIPIYLAIGGMLSSLPGRRLKVAALAVLAVLYAYQTALLLPANTRPNWKGVAQYIKQELGPDDIVLARPCCLNAAVAAYALKETDLPVINASSYRIMIGAVNYFLANAGPGTDHPNRTVWMVSSPYNDPAYPVPDTHGFASCGFNAVSRVFRGGAHVLVWRIRRGEPAPGQRLPVQEYGADGQNWRQALESAGIKDADSRTRRLLFNITDGMLQSWIYFRLEIAYDVFLANRPDLAEHAVAWCLEGPYYKCAQSHVAKALLLLQRGDTEAAGRAFEEAGRYNVPARRMLREMAAACCSGDRQAAQTAIGRLIALGFNAGIPWREMNRMIGPGGRRVWPPGLYPLRAEDYDRFVPEFETVKVSDAVPPESLARIGELLETANRIPEAVDIYGRALLKDPQNRDAQAGLKACAEPVQPVSAPLPARLN